MMNLVQIQPESARLNTGRRIHLGASKQERRDRVFREPRCTDRGGKIAASVSDSAASLKLTRLVFASSW